MARYQNAMQTPGAATDYAEAIGQFMVNEGFNLVNYKGFKVWKKGVGILTAPQFFSIQYSSNTIFLEAFLRYPILPGVYVGEIGISGAFAAIPKNLLKGRVQAVERYIFSLWQAPPPQEYQQMPPQGYQQQMPPQGYQQPMQPPQGYQQQMPPQGYQQPPTQPPPGQQY
jgi:hypothetical protein